mgnify:CR=1 FL=1
MDFTLGPELGAFQARAREYVASDVMCQIEPYEETSTFPAEIFRAMGREGFIGVSLPGEYGGLDLGTLGFCILSEEVAKASAGLTHNGHYQTQRMLLRRGTDEQKAKYLSKLVSGEYVAAMAISEPGVGSSFEKMQTSAKKVDGGYVLKGFKTNINDAAEADVVTTFAVADEGLTIFLVDKGNPGFQVLRKLDPMGMRSSPLYEFALRDCHIPREQVLGKPGRALAVFFEAFNFSRLGNASALLGIARFAFEQALAFAAKREVGHRKVSEFQGIRWMLAEMKTRTEAAALLRDRAAVMEDQGQDAALECSMAKLLCGEVAMGVVPQAIEIMGSYGTLRTSPLPRLLLDAKTLCIAGGTLEVMKNNIAGQLLGRGDKQ